MLETLIKIAPLALIDAINPCTLTIQAFLLAALLITKGRKQAFLGGMLFTLTIYAMYFFYGLGILKAIYTFSLEGMISILLFALIGAMIIIELLAYFSYDSRIKIFTMPEKFREFAKKAIASLTSPFAAIPLAILCSLLLLPCTSGPYLSAIFIIAQSDLEKIAILLYYNFIFILPMIGITILIAFGMSPERVLKWRKKYKRYFHLISAALLIAVLIMLLGVK